MPESPDTYLAYYVVLVTDVLGQSSRLSELRDLPQSLDEIQRVRKTLQDTVGVLIWWRNGFKDFFCSWNSPVLTDIKDSVIRACSSNIAYRHFSDTIIVSVCLSEDASESRNPMMGVLGTLLAASAMHLLSLSGGHPTRGGIDAGPAMPLPEGDIYGPALADAYHLEKTVAMYPRVAVGHRLNQYIEQVASSQETHNQFDKVAKGMAHSCQRLIFPDSDGTLALDFLGEEMFQRDIEARRVLIKSLPKAYQFVRAEQLHWHAQNDSKLAVRYDMLWDYFRSRAHIWGTEINHLADELDCSK
jgi:hypothetical protein